MNKIEELRPEEEETSSQEPPRFLLCPEKQQKQRLTGMKLYKIQANRSRTDLI